jgi:hypothetical protein
MLMANKRACAVGEGIACNGLGVALSNGLTRLGRTLASGYRFCQPPHPAVVME